MSDIKEQFKERNKKLTDEFRKIIGIIESDYLYMNRDDEKRDPSELDWDVYRLILRNYANIALSAPKAFEMQCAIDSLIKADHEDFDSATTTLYTHFVNILNR